MEIEDLKRVDFLGCLDDETLEFVHGQLRPAFFAQGEKVIEQGQPGGTFYLIGSGRVDVTVSDGTGEERYVGTLEAGDYFGEHSLLTGEPTTANVVAETDLEVGTLDKVAFERIFEASAEAADRISKTIGERKAKRNEALAKAPELFPDAAEPATSESEVQAYATSLLGKIRQLFKL